MASENKSDCVNSVVNLFNFATEASICLIVCNIINIENVDNMWDTIQADESVGPQELFSVICTQITDLVWPHVGFKSIHKHYLEMKIRMLHPMLKILGSKTIHFYTGMQTAFHWMRIALLQRQKNNDFGRF